MMTNGKFYALGLGTVQLTILLHFELDGGVNFQLKHKCHRIAVLELDIMV